jgi:hypothetical protein
VLFFHSIWKSGRETAVTDVETSQYEAQSKGVVVRDSGDMSEEYKARLKGVRTFVWSYFLLMLALFSIAILVSLGPGPATPF